MLFPPVDPAVPNGFQYLPEWIAPAEEQGLLARVGALSFSEVRMHGVVAKRRQRGTGRETAEWLLEPRSAYVLSGEARSSWQHAIPPTKALRYSITFRTVNKTRRGG